MNDLPILGAEAQIMGLLASHSVIIVCGEPGSGKTTQLPLMLYRQKSAFQGNIGITQPRRLAAVSVAKYVAGQLETEVGQIVGYKIRFDRNVGDETRIQFMTTGILLRELARDPLLKHYKVIIVDEAHEQQIEIDLLLGLLREVLKKRTDLKLIVASATMDTDKFSTYFGKAPVVNVEGRLFPIEVEYLQKTPPKYDELLKQIAMKVHHVHHMGPDGDILIFMSCKEDIYDLIEEIEKFRINNLLVLPLYGGIQPEEQEKIFAPAPGLRKVIVATNIAETSLTIPGVTCVIDSGLVKESRFDVETGIESLDVIKHSQAGCNQRKGRAGRVAAGVCYRMYSEKEFAKRPKFTSPEMQRKNLDAVVLYMETRGIPNVKTFDFINKPSDRAVNDGYQSLSILGALNVVNHRPTILGHRMSEFPLQPYLARLLCESVGYGCVVNVTIIAAFLSSQNIFRRPRGHEDEADMHHAILSHPESDPLTFLKIWGLYMEKGGSREWCKEYFLDWRALEDVKSIVEQLSVLLQKKNIPLSNSDNPAVLMRCIVSACTYNIMERVKNSNHYSGLFNATKKVEIHPSSPLAKKKPRFLIASFVLETSRVYIHHCTQVKIEWLPVILPQLFKCGKPVLISYKIGDNHAMGEQGVLYKGEVIGKRPVRIVLDVAKQLNEDQKVLDFEKGTMAAPQIADKPEPVPDVVDLATFMANAWGAHLVKK